MPRLAIQRLEVLKEGAAATYGSDAIAGVVNILTRKDFVGLEISAGHTDIEDSDGTQEFGLIGGIDIGNFTWVTSLGYRERNELSLRDRDYSQTDFAANPQGGFSSIGNPGVFFDPSAPATTAALGISPFAALAGAFGAVKDPNCEALGGVDNSLFCRFRYTDFDNAIEDEKHYQLFSEINGEFDNGMGLHAEFLYSKIDVPNWKTSPSYPPQALFGDIQAVPADHPGLVLAAAQHPELPELQAFIDDGEGAVFYGRLQGVGAGVGREAKREYDTYRLAANLDGQFSNDIGWDVGFAWSRSEGELDGVDARIGRTKLAFQGFGGNGCGANLDNAGNLQTNGAVAGQGGCLYYNPFSNSIATSNAESTLGAVNPDFDASVANSDEILAYLDDTVTTEVESNLLVIDAIFQGDLFDGQAAWAGGYQYRRTDIESTPDNLNNLDINPCAFEGQTNCTAETGLRSFLSGGRPVDEDQDVHSLFFETALNISENLDLQLAVRYEDYGDSDTFDPKLSGRYDVTDWLTLRGAVQTTFRGPDLDATAESRVTALSFVGPTAAFKAIDIVGNPDVQPEEAFTWNLGAVINPMENLTITLDYWTFDFENPIVVESFNDLVNAYVAGGAAKEAVQSQIFCTGGTNDGSCEAAAIERIEVQTINGPSLETSGIDLFVDYLVEAGPGLFNFGLDVSHTLEYEIDDYVKGGVLVADSFDGAGFLNAGRSARPLPDLKGRARFEYTMGNHNASLFVNYTNSYDDERTSLVGTGVKVDSHTTVDLHYQIRLMEEKLRLNFSATNLTDEDPPLARVDLNYDAYTHNGIGRMLRFGVVYTLGGDQ